MCEKRIKRIKNVQNKTMKKLKPITTCATLAASAAKGYTHVPCPILNKGWVAAGKSDEMGRF
jgi:hypothetical protein